MRSGRRRIARDSRPAVVARWCRPASSVAIPEGHGGFVLPRSGLAAKHGVTCINAPGLIDAGYRGEVMVALVNLDPTNDYEVKKGDRIAQLVVLARARGTLRDRSRSSRSAKRGEGGFGSSGR